MKTEITEPKIRAWHFISDDYKLRDGRDAIVGETYVHEGDIKISRRGLHASRHPLDALSYAPGSTLCLVECWGDVVEQEQGDNLVCRHRKIVAMQKIESELRLFACFCARQVWHLLTDKRSRNAIEVAEKFALGNATKDELTSAWDAADAAWTAAARAATGDAAGAAPWNAAGDAAGAAPWNAAGDAAGAAAWAAAGNARDAAQFAQAAALDAARSAARSAAWAAAGNARDAAAAAQDAAQFAQRAEFVKKIEEIFKGKTS